MNTKSFAATVGSRRRGGIAIKLPFDPWVEWGEKERHDVTGTVNGRGVRGTLTSTGGEHYLESLATFYRKGYVRWIEEAKRPETRAKRITETVAALKAGKKER